MLVEFGGLWDIQVQILIINWNQFQNPHLSTTHEPDWEARLQGLPGALSHMHTHLGNNTILHAIFDYKE